MSFRLFFNLAPFSNSQIWAAPSYVEASWHLGKEPIEHGASGEDILSTLPPDLSCVCIFEDTTYSLPFLPAA